MTTAPTSDEIQAELMRRAGPAFIFDPAVLFRDVLLPLAPQEASIELSRFVRKCDTSPPGHGWIVRAMYLDEQTLALREKQIADAERQHGAHKD